MQINPGSMLPQRRPLPVIVLADTSTSMEGVKINTLNFALSEMTSKLSDLHDTRGQIHLGVVTFATNAQQVLPITPIEDVIMPTLSASGMTAMGAAFQMTCDILEDENQLPKRAWSPTIVLVSDGLPNDEWQEPLQRLLDSPKGKRAVRVAIGIGEDCDFDLLKAFINHPEVPVFRADQVEKITDFFRFVTFSVMSRSMAKDPNSANLPLHLLDEDNLEF